MKPTSTAIIIGGGVIGLSTAYHLAQKRFGRIILLEKEHIGDGSSSRAGGIVTGLLWTKTGVEARKISLSRYSELSEELSQHGYSYQNVGCLNLFDPASWTERQPLLRLYDQLGTPYEVLDAAEINYRWPSLTSPDEIIGLHDPLGGYSEPEHYLPALAKGCRDLRVEIREETLVERIVSANDTVKGVEIKGTLLEADVVICTVHTWALQLLASLDIQLPMQAVVHQRYLTTPYDEPINLPAVNANPYDGYIRPAHGNRLLVGGETPERITFNVPSLSYRMEGLTAPAGLKETLYHEMCNLVPNLKYSRWASEHVGLLSFSMDEEPILGEAHHLKNLFIGGAFHSGGFAYNPAAGVLLAELVADSQTQIDIETFSPGRFSQEATEEFLKSTRPIKTDGVSRRH